MAEITVQFKNAINGYSKTEVDSFLKNDVEQRLQQKSAEIADLQKQVADLEAKLEAVTGGDAEAGEKLELYEKLMAKMNGDYENLLAPAIAKAKAIEAESIQECEIRRDQLQIDAEGVYAQTAEKVSGSIAEAVDNNLERIFAMVDEHIRSRTLAARVARALYGIKTRIGNFGSAIGNAVKSQVKTKAEAEEE